MTHKLFLENIHSLSEINQQATEVLVREMGIVDTLRFLSQFSRGTGDYTQEHGHWMKLPKKLRLRETNQHRDSVTASSR